MRQSPKVVRDAPTFSVTRQAINRPVARERCRIGDSICRDSQLESDWVAGFGPASLDFRSFRFHLERRSMADNVWYLKRCDLFEQLPQEELRHVEGRSRIRRFARSSPVYLPSEHADGVLLLLSGRVKICSFTADGKQGILTFIENGELFGELSILEEGEREEYAEAVEASSIMLIPGAEMQRLLARYPQISLGITKLMGMRRRRIERRLKYLLFHSNRQRLVHLILELADDYGIRTPDGIDLGIKLSHQDLANIIGSTRETVTVILGELQKEGSLKIRRRKILIIEPDRLSSEVDVKPKHRSTEKPRRTLTPSTAFPAQNLI